MLSTKTLVVKLSTVHPQVVGAVVAAILAAVEGAHPAARGEGVPQSLPLAPDDSFLNIASWRAIHAMTWRGSNSRKRNWIGNLSDRPWSCSGTCVPTGPDLAPPWHRCLRAACSVWRSPIS